MEVEENANGKTSKVEREVPGFLQGVMTQFAVVFEWFLTHQWGCLLRGAMNTQ